jgi:hypothetical protein
MELAQNVIAGIVLILILFWLFNQTSQSQGVISAISQGTIGTIQALQGYSSRGGGQFYGGGQ